MDKHTILSLIHVFVFVPLLFVIAFTEWIPRVAVAVLGAFIALYHASKAWFTGSWVNMLHAIVVGPVLIAHGLTQQRWTTEVIRMLGFAGLGYHGYYLIRPLV